MPAKIASKTLGTGSVDHETGTSMTGRSSRTSVRDKPPNRQLAIAGLQRLARRAGVPSTQGIILSEYAQDMVAAWTRRVLWDALVIANGEKRVQVTTKDLREALEINQFSYISFTGPTHA